MRTPNKQENKMIDKLYHISEASKLLGLTENELNELVDKKKIPFAVSSMTKMIKQSTIDEIFGIHRIGGEGNKIENLTWVNPDKT